MTVALACMRLQPLHDGHTNIINKMIADYQTVIIGLGSAGKKPDKHDPWSIEYRSDMLRNVYGNRIKIVPLNDLGTCQHSNDWVDYVLDKIDKIGLPQPLDYLTGSEADAVWYKDRFYNSKLSKWKEGARTSEKDNPNSNFYLEGRLRKLYIIDRNENPVPSATEIRMFLETRTDGWKKWTPAVNHKIIESTYPDAFRVKVS
jgi:nicotinamide mononucleotide adenylyltransferase